MAKTPDGVESPDIASISLDNTDEMRKLPVKVERNDESVENTASTCNGEAMSSVTTFAPSATNSPVSARTFFCCNARTC